MCLAAAMAQADEPALPIEQLVQQITAQVVQVIASTGVNTSYGSAVLVGAGQAVTSCHVIGAAGEVYVTVGVEPQRVKLLAADRFHDLCLLSLPATFKRPAPVCRPSSRVAVGEQGYAVGFASGRLGFSRGKLQARYALDGGHVLRTGAGFLPGASGGGLFDDRGRLVGVLTFIRRGGATPAYLAVPCEWVAALAERTEGGARPDVATDAPPFWQLIDQGSAAAPRFMQALRLEAEERWPELEALAARWQADAPGDEGARAMAALARQKQGRTPAAAPASAAAPADAARLTQQEDAQCQSNGGQLVSLQRTGAAGDPRMLRVWVERWHLGMKTADRTRHLLAAGGAPAPLGCSRTTDGEQRWEIVDASYVDR